MRSRWRNMVLAAAVLAAGAVGLFLPVSAFGGTGVTFACGSAVVAVDHAVLQPDMAAACDSAISGRRHWAVPLVIVGAAGILAGVLVRGRQPERTTS